MKALTFLTAILFTSLALTARAEEAKPNLLTNAKVGDWVEYSMKASAKGHDIEMSNKRTVTAKDDKSVTMKIETTVMGRQMPGRDVTIPLDKPFHPGVDDPNAKIEDLEQGDEKVTVNGKDYDTHWYKYKGTTKNGAAVEGKVWLAKDIPLGGMVKMEGSTERGNVTMTLSNFGSGK